MYKEQFIHLPKVLPRRSKFKFRPKNYTTLNVGELVPLYKPIEVIPGDTWKIKLGSLLEMTTMVSMNYDTLFMDVFWFYVPFRLLWDDYIYFYGESKKDPYDSIGVYSIPQVKIPEGGYEVGTIANYFGIRPGVGSTSNRDETISALPFRAYAKIVNEYFIADYIDSKANVNYDISSTVVGSNGDDYVVDLVLGGKPFKVNKLHDRFTSALPKPQAADSVPLPLGDNAFVYPGSEIPAADMIKYANPNTGYLPQLNVRNGALDIDPPAYRTANGAMRVSSTGTAGVQSDSTTTYDTRIAITNQYADLSSATSTTINDLRMAIIVQHMLEAESRHGDRYFEQLVGDYGVVNDDLTLQRPEYLGGTRFTLNVNPVVQTSSTSGDSAQGNVSAYSITVFQHTDVKKSFKEPGYIICLGCVRYPHSYPQGLDKLWKKKEKFDFYNHHFEGMGEVPVFNSELFFSGTSEDDEVFGYMPYATEYRSMDSIATGEMSPDYSQPLLTYHYGDDYNSTPRLSSSWLKEDPTNVDRTLQYPHTTVSNFRCRFQFNCEAWRPLSVYGVPGLRRL